MVFDMPPASVNHDPNEDNNENEGIDGSMNGWTTIRVSKYPKDNANVFCSEGFIKITARATGCYTFLNSHIVWPTLFPSSQDL